MGNVARSPGRSGLRLSVCLALAVAACGAPATVPGKEAATVAVAGVEQAVWCAGEGPAVVLVHGIGDTASSQQWQQAQRLLSADARVCRYDRPGAGDSPPPSSQGRGADDLVAELDAVVDHAAGEAPVILVAHSFGGYLVRIYAERHPERVRGLVFADALDPSVGLRRGTGAERPDDVGMADERLDLADIEAPPPRSRISRAIRT